MFWRKYLHDFVLATGCGTLEMKGAKKKKIMAAKSMMRKIKDLLLQLCLSTNEKIMACSPREHYFTIIRSVAKMKKKNSINKDGNPP